MPRHSFVMIMEMLTSRKSAYIRHVRSLAADSAYRATEGEFLCDGMKLLQEAVAYGAEIKSVLWKSAAETVEGLCCPKQFAAEAELFDYASPMKNSPGPLFSVAMPAGAAAEPVKNALVLEGVQDPGNVGTVIRTANAFGVGAVILTGSCADLYNPKTVRATMGAIFRQRVVQLGMAELKGLLAENALQLYGAALCPESVDVRSVEIKRAAVAVGSEGSGLTKELLDICTGKIIIPMQPDSESLNAAVAASVLMWEMAR